MEGDHHYKAWACVGLTAVLALTAAYLFWPPRSGNRIPAHVQATALPAGVASEPRNSKFSPHAVAKVPVGAVRPEDTKPEAAPRQAADSGVQLPHDIWTFDYSKQIETEIRLDPPAIETLGDPGIDAQMAYRLYVYYSMCTNAMRTGEDVDRYLEAMAKVAGKWAKKIPEKAYRTSTQTFETMVDQTVVTYETCSPIQANVNRRMQAFVWLSEAVRLGHEVAQIQYYDKAMDLILHNSMKGPPLVMRHPELIDEFKATARLALEHALDDGHPEAFVAMAQAESDGVIYARDPVLALAYAKLAERASMGSPAASYVNTFMQYALTLKFLNSEQRAEAEKMAEEMWLKREQQ